MFYIGCHLSAAKGYLAMGKEAVKLGANVFQFFTRNPRGGSVKALDLEDIEKYNAFHAEHRFGTLLAHAPYTMNPLCRKGGPAQLCQKHHEGGFGEIRAFARCDV